MNKKAIAVLSLVLLAGSAIAIHFLSDRSGQDGDPPTIERITKLLVGGEAWARLELDLQTNWHLSSAPDAISTPVNLPEVDYSVPSADPLSTPEPRKRAIYRTMFTLQDLPDRASCARIQVTGAKSGATVSLNGQSLGKSEYPDLTFHVEASRALKRRRPNLLELDLVDWDALKVQDVFRPVDSRPDIGPLGLHYLFRRAELMGPIRLQLSGNPRIEKVRISPSVSRQTVGVDTTLASCTGERVPAKVRFQIFTPEGKAGPAKEHAVTVEPSGTKLKAELPGGDLKPWGTPPHGSSVLYTLVTTVFRGSKVVDQTAERFGYREVRSGAEGLLLNGKRLFIVANRNPPLHNSYQDYSKMLSAFRFHGFNGWAYHQGATQHEPFDLADELGGYQVPGLVCIGGLSRKFDKWPARTRTWFRSYFRAWIDTFHRHPSILLWGQETIHKLYAGPIKIELDRPAVDIDMKGVQGTVDELIKMKQELARDKQPKAAAPSSQGKKRPSQVLWIKEVHQEGGSEETAEMLKDFPKMGGISLSYKNPKITRAWSQELLYNGHPMAQPRQLPGVLPELRITASDEGTYLVRRWPVADRCLSGVALEAGERGRLTMGGSGEVALIKNRASGPQKRKIVTIERTPPKKGRPVLKAEF